MIKDHLDKILLFAAFAVLVFLTFNRHSKSGIQNYHSEIWADKAGYYVYLPATFLYDFDASSFPDSIGQKTGNGFFLDQKSNKVRTKYTYGVALLQLPFFIGAHILAKPLGYENDGFSLIYHRAIDLAAVFYLMLGMYFLYRFLRRRFDKNISLLAIISIFLATNLYYYGIDETGMSHIYSFMLFSVFLYFLRRTSFLRTGDFKIRVFIFVLGALILLVRPTNVIFLTSFFVIDAESSRDALKRLKRLSSLVNIVPMLIGVALIAVPQMLYWKYSSGTYLSYSYSGEGFNFASPQLLRTWFSPNNGLFTYTPFYVMILISMLFSWHHKVKGARSMVVFFVVISYVFSSWWDWTFGCGFGARSFIEYLSLFSIPIAYFYTYVKSQSKTKIILFTSVIVLLIAFNLKLTYSYDGCFYGERNWDWEKYIELVFSPTK